MKMKIHPMPKKMASKRTLKRYLWTVMKMKRPTNKRILLQQLLATITKEKSHHRLRKNRKRVMTSR